MHLQRLFPEHAEEQDHVLHDMKLLYPVDSPAEKTKAYYKEKRKLLLWILTGGVILALLSEIGGFLSPVIQNEYRIRRGEYGAGDRFLQLTAYFDEGRASEDIRLQVTEQEYDAAVVEQMMTEVLEQLPEKILGDNVSLDEVRSNLKLVRHIEGYPFEIRWKLNQYHVMNRYGEIQEDQTTNEGTYVELTAFLTYADYEAESAFGIRVYPPVLTPEEELREQIRDETLLRETGDRTASAIELPQEVDGQKLIWRSRRSYVGLIILFLAIVSAIGIYYGKDQELHDLVRKRKKQMELDYAGIISKMALFLGAGMTTKAAWQKIIQAYAVSRTEGTPKRYAYEEMMITYHEISSGISEVKAYERFGIRSNLPRYQVFASIISQSVKRGSKGTIELLLHEMSDAFEERKNIARQLGEEAGTKLLFPMFLMLMIVMVIILVPALLSLRTAA